ncbi:MAG: alanine--tRNA ligase [Eubacteriales bacterium]
MKWTSLNELREKYLSFFESKGHLRHESYSLVPENDKSLLLINAGMAPLKKFFTGESEPPRHRMTTCQKCIRTPDIERVGITARHGTFFEMLGNFSFGDYFKDEAISWAWEFVTEVLEMPRERLWVTIYENDDEAFEIWNKKMGVPADRIVRLGKEDNFWEIGAGPCGPDSEIHFDRGPEYGCGKPTCRPGCDCDRFMEFWNLVFTQFDGDGKGNYTRLAHPNIDTGMGLERIACIMQGVNNLFEVDTVQNIIKAISERAGVKYGEDKKADISLRVIADHTRASTFLISDGVMPSNEGRGYVLRRLIRRACRHARLLGIKGAFIADIAAVVANENRTAYPELTEKLDYIKKVIGMEEARFDATVENGLALLDTVMAKAKSEGKAELCGEDVFKLSDTYGFPIDLTREIANENGLGIDEDGFNKKLAEQKKRARDARAKLGGIGWDGDILAFFDKSKKTEFLGYDNLQTDAKILAIIDGETNEHVSITGENAIIITDKTVFYGEGGGEIGDTGYITTKNGRARVTDTKKADGIYLHICQMESGSFEEGENVTLTLDADRRAAISRNHSAVHLLDAALRNVLGTHIQQAGSYVSDKIARFDFTHFSALTSDELKKVERLVNKKILEGLNVTAEETDIETAKKSGAIALFGEKYGARVRVVRMGDFSSELCGGAHVGNTGKIGLFKIISESSVAAGTRRIEAVTGLEAYELACEKTAAVSSVMSALKVSDEKEIVSKISSLEAEIKEAKRALEEANLKIAKAGVSSMLANATILSCGLKTVYMRSDMPMNTLRSLGDDIKAENDDIVALLTTENGGKLTLCCVCGKNAVKKGVSAPAVLKETSSFVGGGGGGRPDSATAGAKDPSRLQEAFDALPSIVEKLAK